MDEPGPKTAKGVPIDPAAVKLVLLGAMVWAAENRIRHGNWGEGDWQRVLRDLDSREAVTVILHTIRGLTLEEIAVWLGVSRGMSHVLWKRACRKLGERFTREEIT